MNLFRKDRGLFFLLLNGGLALRLLVSPYYTHYNDLGLWLYWAKEIYVLGFNNFFSKIGWTDYLPLYFYPLFAIEWLRQIAHIQGELIFKIPAIAADLLSAVVIYKITNYFKIKGILPKQAPIAAAAIYLFNPAIFANSAMWGQIDGIGALLVLLSVLLLIQKRVIPLGITLALAILLKPHYLIMLPLILVATTRINRDSLKKFTLSFVVSAVLIVTPFVNNPFETIPLLITRYQASLGQYPYASVNAFNFWGSVGANFVSDQTTFLSLSYHSWGLVLFGSIYLFVLFRLMFEKIHSLENYFLTLVLSLTLSFFSVSTFATNVHERHLLTALALLSLLTLKSKLYLYSYFALSLIYVVNLYFGYEYLIRNGGFVFDNSIVQIISAIVVAINILLLINFVKPIPATLRNINLSFQKPIILILVVAAFLRLYNLWYPQGYVFDEVYHGFTAREYLKNNIAAWEWWNTPPPGVAYEWTHPPLAKEIMAVSMWFLKSTDAWAYRLPGVLLGIISIYLVYLLGKKVFQSERIGLVSAFVFSLDGLNFVQSRTGMNDIYFVTFMLFTVFFFLNRRFFLAAVFLGLALASKWTGFYLFAMVMVLAILGRLSFKNLLYFYLIPPVVYLLSYTPFFWYGHSWDTFMELQKQMWWYHTNLRASHDYASPWWSWPFNLYPVWYFVDYHPNGTISNIFASGNPLMFWLGTLAVIVSVKEFIQKKTRNLIVPLLGYLIFFLPWALSPRIMFLYHFSPSVPFMALLLSYQIENFSNSFAGGKVFSFNLAQRQIIIFTLFLIALGFLFVYPMLVGVPLDRQTMLLFFRTNLTKNPFGW